MGTTSTIDWLLIGRYALLVALSTLLPVPILDTALQNALQRRMVRSLAMRHNADLDPESVAVLANTAGGGCVGCLWGALVWPVMKLLRTVLIFLQAKQIADTASEQVHRALMLEEALESGWLPGDPIKVRQAMDRTLDRVDTRVVERRLAGVFRDHTNALNRFVFQATALARERTDAVGALADAADRDTLGPEIDSVSRAMTAALRTAGAVPELLQWFRLEMGAAPDSSPAVAGLLEPVEVLPPEDDDDHHHEPGPQIEEAQEVASREDP